MSDTARIIVTLTEPVAAGKRLRTDFVQDTYDHVPGTVLRGALAARWIAEHGVEVTKSRDFLEVFEGSGSFAPLHSEASVPAPLSVKVHKYGPGPTCTTLWWDAATGDEQQHCTACGDPLEFSKGAATGTVPRQRRTRTALTTQGVAAESQLFTQNSVARGTRFAGWLHGPALRALRLAEQPIDEVFLGGRTKLQGTAKIELDDQSVPDPVEQHGNELVLRLLGPGVFVDRFGFPSSEPDLDELSEVLGVEARSIKRPWTRWCEIGGWHVASGLPKPTERAVQAGSTYRIKLAEPADEDARRRLMARGIGLRRREGFGALYSVGQAPVTAYRVANRAAAMRGDSRLAEDRPLLRQRVDDMRHGLVDDSRFAERLAVDDRYSTGLRALLRVVDPQLFSDALDVL
ncbi:hypothetical protein INP57_22720 [Saccharopolyspora sp. HNM0986]|uniref:type III-B CRISPR module-associated Cmr3 family protein n=1 Tax=Saccharopolyspora galaxeae TaxID=2781241 RepID=UPI00190924B2|nr:type III-B CRISPR module-associated Cmr3 family protein [Saccharopolyspora sp. HNM0986]MBK0869632.1 hypothetical protein [Saccharopolyspora sp. HNM0986]